MKLAIVILWMLVILVVGQPSSFLQYQDLVCCYWRYSSVDGPLGLISFNPKTKPSGLQPFSFYTNGTIGTGSFKGTPGVYSGKNQLQWSIQPLKDELSIWGWDGDVKKNTVNFTNYQRDKFSKWHMQGKNTNNGLTYYLEQVV